MSSRFFTLVVVPFIFWALSVCSVSAQQFLPSIQLFSGKKPGYLVLKSGERIEFTLDKLDRKKGLIFRVAGSTPDGQKFKHEADQIQELGLTSADFAKFLSLQESTRSVARMQRNKVSESMRDLVIFYNERLDDPKREALLQLVNPGFDSQIRVYDDPFSAETMSVGFGVQVSGGLEASYYVKVRGQVIRLKKRNYVEMFRPLFDSCAPVMARYGKDIAWRDFGDHVFMLDQECGGIEVK